MEVVVLASDSHTLDGCDRVVLTGDRVLVQGTPAAYPDTAPLRVPDGEALTGISVEVFLEAASELQRRLGRPMSADLLAMYRQATREVFRLEARQQYAVEAESAQVKAFAAGQPLPHDPAVQRSMDIISQARAAGTRIYRVHVVDLPLTPYLRYELAAYQENLAAGEEVFITVRSQHRELAGITEDFVLFDPGTSDQAVVWMRYDAEGRVTSRERSDDPADAARACHVRDVAMAHAVPLTQFAAMVEAG